MDGTLVKDRYLVQKKLGHGGFAVTYLAIDMHLDSRPVVVKVLLEHRSDDAWALKKFRQEMQVLARLDHPGIVAALDSGELPDGKPFLVMQFVKGVTLREEITPRGMNLERTAHIVRQLGQALSAAHDGGICQTSSPILKRRSSATASTLALAPESFSEKATSHRTGKHCALHGKTSPVRVAASQQAYAVAPPIVRQRVVPGLDC
jgi:serine/threonine protein kinase